MTHSFFIGILQITLARALMLIRAPPFPRRSRPAQGINLCLSVRSVGQKKQRRNLRHLRNLRDLTPGPHNFYLI